MYWRAIRVTANLTPRQLDVLAAYRDGCRTIREVGFRLGLSHATVVEHAQALSRAGALCRSGRAYVVADRCPTCRRRWPRVSRVVAAGDTRAKSPTPAPGLWPATR